MGAAVKRFEPTEEEHRVTTLELFFDLVFVFAFTQVTALMADDLSAQSLFRGLVLLAILWFAWAAYSWLGNQARADEGVLRLSMVLAMGAMFVAALAVPEAWNDLPGGLNGPVVLAVAIAAMRVLHLVAYAIAAGEDTGLRRQLVFTSIPVLLAATLLVTGAMIGGRPQTVLWLTALAVDYGGILAAGSSGWRLRSPSHFAERHGLIIIIALGESIVSIGIGVAALPVSGPIVVASLLGLAVCIALWWLYFDVMAIVGERALVMLPEDERPARARNSYSYLHLPMVAGIVVMAVGLKKATGYVAGVDDHVLSDPLKGLALIVLFVGPVVYLLGHMAFRWLNARTIPRERILVVGLLILAIPLCQSLPALASLGTLAAILGGLIAYEFRRYRTIRYAIRHGDFSWSPALAAGEGTSPTLDET